MRGLAARPDADAVRAAAAAVVEPETGLTLGELGAVGGVRTGRGAVDVAVGLLTPDDDVRARVVDAVVSAVRGVTGTAAVEVTAAPLDQRARLALGERVRASSPPALRTPRVYAVASGKGGVGKSTVTANLAVALAARGLRVGLLDADVWGWSVPQLFGVRRHPIAVAGMMFPVRAHGVALMSVGFLLPDDRPVAWRGPMLHKALEQFLGDVAWGPLDVLLLDLPPGTGDVPLSVLELLPDAALLAVTTPQAAAWSVAERVARLATESRMPVAGIVENMSAAVCDHCGGESAVFGTGGGAELAGRTGAPLLARIPLDLALREAGDRGVPAVAGAPDAPSARALTRLAEDLPWPRRSLVGRALPLAVVGGGPR